MRGRRKRLEEELISAKNDLTLWMMRHLETSQPEGAEVEVDGRRYRLSWWPRLERLPAEAQR